MVCDMSEAYEFPSLHSCHERILWTHREVDLAPHLVVGFALQEEDADKFSRGTRFLKPGSSSQSQQAGSVSHSHREGSR